MKTCSQRIDFQMVHWIHKITKDKVKLQLQYEISFFTNWRRGTIPNFFESINYKSLISTLLNTPQFFRKEYFTSLHKIFKTWIGIYRCKTKKKYWLHIGYALWAIMKCWTIYNEISKGTEKTNRHILATLQIVYKDYVANKIKKYILNLGRVLTQEEWSTNINIRLRATNLRRLCIILIINLTSLMSMPTSS